jgi:hypothetical protein
MRGQLSRGRQALTPVSGAGASMAGIEGSPLAYTATRCVQAGSDRYEEMGSVRHVGEHRLAIGVDVWGAGQGVSHPVPEPPHSPARGSVSPARGPQATPAPR